MKGKTISGVLTNILFYVLVAGLMGYTIPLDYKFLARMLSETPSVAAFGLIMFDLGMVGWLMVFLNIARGTVQRAIAFSLTILSLIGVGLLAVGEQLTESADLITTDVESLPTYVSYLIAVMLFSNLAGALMFHLNDPEAKKAMALSSLEDDVWDTAMEKLEAGMAEISSDLAEIISGEVLETMTNKLMSKYKGDDDTEYVVTRKKKGWEEKERTAKERQRENRAKRKAAKKEANSEKTSESDW